MHSVRVLWLVAFAGLCACLAVANEEYTNDTDVWPDNSRCDDRVCPRVYHPVCGSVDGVPMTAPSRCDLNNKMRCAKLLRSMRDLRDAYIPVVRFLHDGPCPAEVDSSTVERMKRNASSSAESDDDDDDDDDDEYDDSSDDEYDDSSDDEYDDSSDDEYDDSSADEYDDSYEDS